MQQYIHTNLLLLKSINEKFMIQRIYCCVEEEEVWKKCNKSGWQRQRQRITLRIGRVHRFGVLIRCIHFSRSLSLLFYQITLYDGEHIPLQVICFMIWSKFFKQQRKSSAHKRKLLTYTSNMLFPMHQQMFREELCQSLFFFFFVFPSTFETNNSPMFWWMSRKCTAFVFDSKVYRNSYSHFSLPLLRSLFWVCWI